MTFPELEGIKQDLSLVYGEEGLSSFVGRGFGIRNLTILSENQVIRW
jgi:hypothetical protein